MLLVTPPRLVRAACQSPGRAELHGTVTHPHSGPMAVCALSPSSLQKGNKSANHAVSIANRAARAKSEIRDPDCGTACQQGPTAVAQVLQIGTPGCHTAPRFCSTLCSDHRRWLAQVRPCSSRAKKLRKEDHPQAKKDLSGWWRSEGDETAAWTCVGGRREFVVVIITVPGNRAYRVDTVPPPWQIRHG